MDKTKYHLKWRSHLDCLNSAIGTLYRNEKYTDVVLFCSSQNSDNTISPYVGIPAHKFILSACSEYFATIFDSIPTTSSNGVFCVVLPPELSQCTLQILVEYIYNGEATVSEDLLNEVVRGGQILKIRGLYEYHAQRQGSSGMLNITSVNGNDFKETLVQLKKNAGPYNPTNAGPANMPEQMTRRYTRLNKNGHTPRISVNKQVAIDPELRSTHNYNKDAGLVAATFEGMPAHLVTRDNSVTPSPPPPPAHAVEKNTAETETNFGLIKHEPPDWTGSWSELSSAQSNMTRANSLTNVKFEMTNDVAENDSSQPYVRCSSCDICKSNLSDVTLRPDQHATNDNDDDNALASVLRSTSCASNSSSAAKTKIKNNEKNPNHSNYSTENLNVEISTEPKIIVPKKRRRTSQHEVADNVTLLCDLCNTAFEGAAEWVRHMNNEHTEIEMAIFNSKKDLEQRQAQSNMRNAIDCDFIDNSSISNKNRNDNCHRKRNANKMDQHQHQSQGKSSHDNHHHENNGKNYETCNICKTKYTTYKSFMMHQCKHTNNNYSNLKRSSTSSLSSSGPKENINR